MLWTPALGDVLHRKLEESNNYDHFTICVKHGEQILGHIARECILLENVPAKSTIS